MKGITVSKVRTDLIDFALIVKRTYLPELLRDIEEATESEDVPEDVIALLEKRYDDLEAATADYLIEDDFYIKGDYQ